MAERQRLNLHGDTELHPANRGARQRSNVRDNTNRRVQTRSEEISENQEDEDEDILSDIPERGQGKSKLLNIVVGIAVVIVVVFVFLVFLSGRDRDEGGIVQNPTENSEQEQDYQSGNEYPTDGNSVSNDEGSAQPGVGTQDFTANTNMTTSDTLTDPDKFIEDIYGLTTRVDYTVNSISEVADFVSYEKHRGTWGGGLELYWLDATYKNSHYVIQVPFEYYKELDDTGIVPVRMEVLTINGSTPDEKLTVISYMCLDEEVLKDILKDQSKLK